MGSIIDQDKLKQPSEAKELKQYVTGEIKLLSEYKDRLKRKMKLEAASQYKKDKSLLDKLNNEINEQIDKQEEYIIEYDTLFSDEKLGERWNTIRKELYSLSDIFVNMSDENYNPTLIRQVVGDIIIEYKRIEKRLSKEYHV